MKIDRHFTQEGQDPYQNLEFETRSSVIRNPDGSVVSEWNEVVVPKQWSQVATDIMAQKYFRKAGVPKHLRSSREKNMPEWLQPSVPDQAKFQKPKRLTDMDRKQTPDRFFNDSRDAGPIGGTSMDISMKNPTHGHFMMN